MAFGILKNWWNSTGASAPAASPRPQDRQYDGPPTPTSDWRLIVDSFGDPVIGRKPDGTDFLARYPIEYDYRGTIPAFDKDQYTTKDERIAAGMAHAVRNHENASLLKKAVFLLSQQDDGRRLLEMAQREGFHFVFDQERMTEAGALGMCDYSKKQIPLAEGRSPAEVSLTLKHELQHMEDNKNGLTQNRTHTVTSSLIANRSLEANARVSEAIACAEGLNGSPQGPERQFRTSALFTNFFASKPHMAQIAHNNLALAKEGSWNDFARPIFDGYSLEHGTLDYYDKRLVELLSDSKNDLELTPPTPPDITSPVRMSQCNSRDNTMQNLREEQVTYWEAKLKGLTTNDRWTHDQEALKETVTIKGQPPYLMGENSPDLNTAHYIGFSKDAKDALSDFLTCARLYVPQRVDEIETGFMAPDRQAAPTNEQPITSPYVSDQKADNFQMIRHPERHDYQGYEYAHHGKSNHTRTTENFAKAYEDYKNSYSGELNRISLAVEYTYRNGNIRGCVKDMVEAGFRAPLAAFPQEYIMDLCKMVQHIEQSGDMPQHSNAELELFSHWKEMAQRGLNPVYGTEELKETATFFEDSGKPYFEDHLKPFFDKITNDDNQSIQSTNRPSVSA